MYHDVADGALRISCGEFLNPDVLIAATIKSLTINLHCAEDPHVINAVRQDCQGLPLNGNYVTTR